jgi:hypothetical protein
MGGRQGSTDAANQRLSEAVTQNAQPAGHAFAADPGPTPERPGDPATPSGINKSKPRNWRTIAAPYLECGHVPEKTRNITLTQIAGRLRWEGHEQATIAKVLHQINVKRCVPPLPATDIYSMARWIAKKPQGKGGNALHRALYEKNQDKAFTVLMLALEQSWTGKSGRTDLAVLRALIQIARQCGRMQFWASVRQIAKAAGIGKSAAANALRRLRATHAVQLIQNGHAHLERLESGSLSAVRQASTWRLGCTTEGCKCIYQVDTKGRGHTHARSDPLPKVEAESKSSELEGYCLSVHVVYAPREDCWRWSGLGKTAELVWGTIGSGQVTVSDLQRRFPGWSTLATPADATPEQRKALRSKRASLRTSIHHALRRLADHGLARIVGGRWERTDLDPESVRGLRSDGAHERQEQDHAHDRDVVVDRLLDKRHRRLLEVDMQIDGNGHHEHQERACATIMGGYVGVQGAGTRPRPGNIGLMVVKVGETAHQEAIRDTITRRDGSEYGPQTARTGRKG